jgi:hypothetical protein
LIVASADLESDLASRPAARQLRRSLIEYMASQEFAPKTSITPADLETIFFDTRIMKRLGATATASGGDATNAIDGDPNTFWLAGDPRAATRSEQSLTIQFPTSVAFSGLVIMPRQNHREHEGDIRAFVIETSDDGNTWTEANRGELESTFDLQKVIFGRTITARFIRFRSLSGFGADKTTALADVAVIYEGPKLPDDEEELEYQRSKSASPDIDEGVSPDDNKKPRRP